jgi:hypothetical protein
MGLLLVAKTKKNIMYKQIIIILIIIIIIMCFMYIKATTLTENYKVAYKLWRERNPNLRTNIDAKLLLNQKNYIQ